MSEDRNCISYWYPKVHRVVPTPKTAIITVEPEWREPFLSGLCGIADGGDLCGRDVRALEAVASLVAKAAEEFGYPCFLRSGHTSGKHDWQDTCYLQREEAIRQHLYRIWEYGEVASIIGLPVNVWAVREMLKVLPGFWAFAGRMPIGMERRYFVRDGKVEWHQPYWPPEALEDSAHPIVGAAPGENWRERLDAMNKEEAHEITELRGMTEKVGAAVPGYWSVDWLLTVDRGWVMIDMALGDQSFRWENYPGGKVGITA